MRTHHNAHVKLELTYGITVFCARKIRTHTLRYVQCESHIYIYIYIYIYINRPVHTTRLARSRSAIKLKWVVIVI